MGSRVICRCKFQLLILLVIAAGINALGNTVWAQVRGVSYTLTPVIEGIRFADDAALKHTTLFGGRIGFAFGEFIELNGIYLFNNDLRTDFGDLSGFDTATLALLRQLPARGVDFHRFGGDVKFNIGRGAFFPFITLGSGVVRFDPAELNKSEAIYLSGGIGVQYSFRERYTVVAQANNLSYRYDPASSLLSQDELASLGLMSSDIERIDVNNFAASIGLQFYLGGRTRGELTDLDRALQEQFRAGLKGIALRLEPTAGEVNFDQALGFRDDQRFVGIAAGIDLGALVSLRGFYWRGTEDDSWTQFDDLQAYGGELKLAFNDVAGSLTPYVMAGGGYMDARDGYVGNGTAAVEDRPFAFGGVGIVLPLGSALSVDGGVRAMLMSSSGVDNVSDPSSVETSTMVTAGISFGLGSGKGKSGGVFGREMAASRSEREQLASKLTGQEQKLSRTETRIDSLVAVVTAQQQALSEAPQSDTVVAKSDPATVAAAQMPTRSKSGQDSTKAETVRTVSPTLVTAQGRGDRWMSVPVPEEGELYVRFGKPGGVSVETIGGEPLTYYIDPTTGSLIPVGSPPAMATTTPAGVATPWPQTVPAGQSPALTPAQVQEIIRGVLREERAQAPVESPATSEAEAIQRLQDAIDSRLGDMEARFATLKEEQASAQKPQPYREVIEDEPTVNLRPPKVQEVAPPVGEAGVVTTAMASPRSRFAGVHPLLGYNIDRPHQALVGVRGELHRPGRPYRLLPEVVVGFGDNKTTYNVNLNGAYDLGIGLADYLYPYGGLGLGFLDRDDLELVLNLLIGSDVRTAYGTFFIEYMNQDFDNNRLLSGYRLRF